MAEGRSVHNEKETLGKSVKSQHKYGTTNRASSTSTYPEYYIRHIVQKDDTLAGIALKYGCSVSRWFYIDYFRYPFQ
jgi:LysM repeat protein